MYSYSSIVMKKDGTLWGCGYNGYDQLGLGHKEEVTIFTELPINGVKGFFSRYPHMLFVKKDGTIWECGVTTSVSTKIPIANIKKISCGNSHNIVMKHDGTLWGWGHNSYGQLGLGHKDTVQIPTQLAIDDIKSVYCGSLHTMFLKNDGTLWAVGNNGNGQLGLGHTDTPILTITKIPISDVKNVYNGGFYTIAMKNDGTLWCWGINNDGQFGNGGTRGYYSPVKMSISDAKDIYCGEDHNIIWKNDSTVWGAGRNSEGQLGLGHKEDVWRFTKIPITDVKSIFCGSYHTIFLKNDSTIWVCGHNGYGQLGLGHKNNVSTLTKIPMDDVQVLSDELLEFVIHFLLSHPNGYATLDGGAVKPLEEEALSKTLFETEGFGDLSQLLPVLDGMAAEFDILTYQEDQANQGIQVSHLPPPQLVIPKEDILLDNGVIAEANLVVTGQAGSVRVVISIDQGYSWQSMVGGWWEAVALSVEAIGSKGVTPDQLRAITESQWAELGGKTIRFAYYLAEGAVVDELALTMNSRNWKRAKRGKDYICAYPSKEIMRVKILADGSYKINYLAVEN